MKISIRRIVMLFISAVVVMLCGSGYGATSEKSQHDPFPVVPELRNAVNFWKKVYSKYTTHQGIIHDNRNLDIIYEIVELDDPKRGGSEKRNQQKITQVKDKYRAILLKFSRGMAPGSTEEGKVAALFGRRATLEDFRTASDRIRCQIGQKDRFEQGVIRSGAYLNTIKAIFRSHGLPEDLAYLPHVESSFDYKAYSKFGAAGIWQFTHSTGKKYMTIDYTQDDRRDPIRASHAAAAHLWENFQRLRNWPMAITAYNHGVNGMARAKAASGGDFEWIIRNYNSPAFGFASRNFYAEFLAALEVAKNHRRYFGELTLEAPVNTTEIRMPGYASIKQVADHYNTDVTTLRKLNLALREPVFSGRKRIPKGYSLHLPAKTTSILSDRIPETMLHAKQIPSRFYRVQKGDTASMIARAHGVRLSDFLSTNGLGPKTRIYVGQNLRIPASEERILLAAASVTPPKQETAIPAESQPEKPAEVQEPEPKAITEETAPSSPSPVDSPPTASVPEPEVPEPKAATEELAPPPLPPTGPQLPASVSEPEVNIAVVTGDLKIEKVIVKGSQTTGIIRVAAEETLGHYADWLGIPTQTIRRLNGFHFHHPIQTNDRIKIPLTKSGQEDFEEKRYEYHKEMEEDFFSVYRIEGETVYTVNKGDNIWRLCQETFELPFWLIQKFNTARDFSRLQPGDTVRIPIVKKMNGEG